MPTNRSLSNAIENQLPATILGWIGINAATPDPDLDSAYRIKQATGGFLILEDDRQLGPLVRVAVKHVAQDNRETGGGTDSTTIFYMTLEIACITSACGDVKTAKTFINEIEGIMRVRMMNLNVGGFVATYTNSKRDYAAIINPLTSDIMVDRSAGIGNAPQFYGVFHQQYQLIIESQSSLSQ